MARTSTRLCFSLIKAGPLFVGLLLVACTSAPGLTQGGVLAAPATIPVTRFMGQLPPVSALARRHVASGRKVQDVMITAGSDGTDAAGSSYSDGYGDGYSDGYDAGSSDSSGYDLSQTLILVDSGPDYGAPVYQFSDGYAYPTPAPDPTPTPPPTFAIGQISVSPTQIATGSSVALSVQATGLPAGQLDYTWQAVAGVLVMNKGEAVEWIAPTLGGSYPITVAVYDPLTGESQTGTANVVVTGG